MIARWWKFNAVGMAGAAVQLAVLWALAQLRGLPYLAAVAFAVEVSLLHNFHWHEVWTWNGLASGQRWPRLLRFPCANGLVSMAGNTLFTGLFHQYAGWPLLVANAESISLTSVLNFALATIWVFAPEPRSGSKTVG